MLPWNFLSKIYPLKESSAKLDQIICVEEGYSVCVFIYTKHASAQFYFLSASSLDDVNIWT